MSPQSRCKVKEAWRRGSERNIPRDVSPELDARYNSHRKGGIQRDPSLGQWVASDSPSRGMWFRQSRQGLQKHPAAPDGN